MTPLRSLPFSRDAGASVDENGESYDLRPETHGGKLVTQVKVYVGGLSFVGFGTNSTPPAAATTNTVYQESGTEEVYVLDRTRENHDYLYVYAESTSVAHAVRVSFFY